MNNASIFNASKVFNVHGIRFVWRYAYFPKNKRVNNGSRSPDKQYERISRVYAR